MSRKRSTTTTPPSNPLPTPGPLSIATREYYRPSTILDANDADIDYPLEGDSLLPSAEPHHQDTAQQDTLQHDSLNDNANAHVQTEDVYDFVAVTQSSGAHSPTASDIVLNADLRDMPEMSALDRELRGRRAEKGERKKALLELQTELVEERRRVAAEARERLEEIEREYEEVQRRGREEI